MVMNMILMLKVMKLLVNSDGGDEDESKTVFKKYKKKIVDPKTCFNCKTFKVSVDG